MYLIFEGLCLYLELWMFKYCFGLVWKKTQIILCKTENLVPNCCYLEKERYLYYIIECNHKLILDAQLLT